jgi:putative SOS response-associated peptidase YedK
MANLQSHQAECHHASQQRHSDSAHPPAPPQEIIKKKAEPNLWFQPRRYRQAKLRLIWGRWKDPSGNWMKTCSILTTTPNAVTSAVHERMPVILDPDIYDLWLDPVMQTSSVISDLLKPCDARLMRCYPVSTRINHVVNDDEECSAPVGLAQIQNDLFS